VPDEILRSGVPHNVTTSVVTRNAVLPQNIFTKEDASALRDSGVDGAPPSTAMVKPAHAFDKTSMSAESQASPNYPVTQDKLVTHDALTGIKSHIKDNIQALKNLAHSDNLQRTGKEEINENSQSVVALRSIQENKIFLEKKSIKSNRQLISKTTNARSAASLAASNATNPSGLNSGELEAQATGLQNVDPSPTGENKSDQDSAFQQRIKKLKGHVRIVDSTLQNLDPEK
jgi:phosphoketolase